MTYKKHKTLTIVILAILLSISQSSFAQNQPRNFGADAFKELRNYKHTFYKKALDLSRDQETQFFKVLDQMDEELFKIGEETRALERKTINDANASETEMESTARTIFEQKKKEGETELRYFDEFKNILSKRQLVMLKDVERRFNMEIIKHRRSQRSRAQTQNQ